MSDNGKVVSMGGRRRAPSPRHIAEFAATARRLQEERDAAANLVERLLRDLPRERWMELAPRPELQTCGALEKLGSFAAQALGRDPRQALASAQLAVSIATSLNTGSYPPVVIAQLCAHAYKDLAKAHLYLGRFDDALAALDEAEARIAPYGALVHDLAIVQLVRAATLQEINRYDEAFAVLASSREIFRNHSDSKRVFICGIAEGVLLHRLQRYREAREAYLLLLAASSDSPDRESIACLHNVIGHCSVDLGDFDAAETYLSRAIELFHAIGQPLQAAKAELGRGRALIRRGEVNRGIAHLRPIRADFLRNALIEEAGLCGLEIVEALLLRGSTTEAEALARQIITEFTSASLNKRAITALGYLSESIASRKASTELVTKVREYIVSLRTSPEREFAFA
jgi:tetratricopeptide (TPR) repeat protein